MSPRVDESLQYDLVGFLRLTCVQISLPPLNPGSIETGYTVAGSVSIACDGTTVSESPSRCTGTSSTRRGSGSCGSAIGAGSAFNARSRCTGTEPGTCGLSHIRAPSETKTGSPDGVAARRKPSAS